MQSPSETIGRQSAPSLALKAKFYPEVHAGGYSRIDGIVQFYLRVRSLLKPTDVVLDLGAGRGGGIATVASEFRRNLMILRGHCRKVVGIDIDEAVLQNPYMDEVHVISAAGPLPFDDSSFDLIYSDWTLEHVADPESFVSEIRRVLKPNGWLCARTPNAFSYQGLITRLIPSGWHTTLLRRIQPDRQARDVFRTEFKMNTFAALRRLFPSSQWLLVGYAYSPEPAYTANSALLWRLTTFLNWLSPPTFRPILNIFVQKH